MTTKPYLTEVNSIGDPRLGYISSMEYPKNLPFEIKRIYWTYHTPNDIIRGFHAHKDLYQMIFAVSGMITFKTEDRNGEHNHFILSNPNQGLFIPPLVWREIKFSHNAVLLCIASMEYVVEDYIREYDEFVKYKIK